MTTPTGIAVALAVIIALGFLFLGDSILAPFGVQGEPATIQTNTMDTNEGQLQQAPEGATAKPGDTVQVNYVGTFQDGTVFDASTPQTGPITFVLGVGKVIKGWDQAIIGMKVGEKKHLVIPPELAYGSQTNGPIPANSTLVFDIELVGIQSAQ